MRIVYTLLSSTFGMHQYTADLANRMARAGHEVHLLTTTRVPRDRYAPAIFIHTPMATTNTGFSKEGLQLSVLSRASAELRSLGPDLVHFTGPHLWNVFLVRALVGKGIPVIHTLHDLEPHRGARFGPLVRIWNRFILRSAHHILVHSRAYYQCLLDAGMSPERVSWTPLLHLFVGSAQEASLPASAASVEYEPWALFFGRLARYKGVNDLITACAMLDGTELDTPRVVLAGPGDLKRLWADAPPPRLQVRNRLIRDDEAVDLFRRCGLLVLPYIDASQSALIAAAYYFGKPVVVTRCGALPEYVVEGATGRIVEPGHPPTLARCLEDLLSNPAQLAKMGAAGRAWYAAQRAAEELSLLEMYEGVLQGQRAKEPTSSEMHERVARSRRAESYDKRAA